MPSSRTSYDYRVLAIIQSACRRRFWVLAFEQLGLALSMIFGGGLLMLLLGTQILSWYWIGMLGVLGLAVASVRVRSRMLSNYRVAQLLDRQLHLSDSLSTAWFLLTRVGQADNPISRLQIQQAKEIAASVRLAKAFEFRGRRIWTLTGALAAAAFGLFAIRYLVTSSLSLQQALIPLQLSAVFEHAEKSLSAERHKLLAPGGVDQRQANSPHLTEPRQNAGRDGSPENPKSGGSAGSGGEPSTGQMAAQDVNTQNKPAESRDIDASNGRPNSGQAIQQTSENQAGSTHAEGSKGQEQQGEGQQNSSGLIDKMKDALSSLMAKMRPVSNGRKPSQNNQPSSNDQKGGDQTASSKDQNGKSPQTAQNEQSAEQRSSEGQAQGQTTEKAQASQGRNSDQSPDRKDSEAHSGVGRQDGDKTLKETEQLQAMGKLAEIIGRRSANVTGEMTVETPSGKQRLKTAYSQRAGHHSDLGGEINRDEIPLIYQQYIREYMVQVRKQQTKNGQ